MHSISLRYVVFILIFGLSAAHAETDVFEWQALQSIPLAARWSRMRSSKTIPVRQTLTSSLQESKPKIGVVLRDEGSHITLMMRTIWFAMHHRLPHISARDLPYDQLLDTLIDSALTVNAISRLSGKDVEEAERRLRPDQAPNRMPRIYRLVYSRRGPPGTLAINYYSHLWNEWIVLVLGQHIDAKILMRELRQVALRQIGLHWAPSHNQMVDEGLGGTRIQTVMMPGWKQMGGASLTKSTGGEWERHQDIFRNATESFLRKRLSSLLQAYGMIYPAYAMPGLIRIFHRYHTGDFTFDDTRGRMAVHISSARRNSFSNRIHETSHTPTPWDISERRGEFTELLSPLLNPDIHKNFTEALPLLLNQYAALSEDDTIRESLLLLTQEGTELARLLLVVQLEFLNARVRRVPLITLVHDLQTEWELSKSEARDMVQAYAEGLGIPPVQLQELFREIPRDLRQFVVGSQNSALARAA